MLVAFICNCCVIISIYKETMANRGQSEWVRGDMCLNFLCKFDVL